MDLNIYNKDDKKNLIIIYRLIPCNLRQPLMLKDIRDVKVGMDLSSVIVTLYRYRRRTYFRNLLISFP